MGVKDLFKDCVLGVAQFFLNGFECYVHVLVAKGKDCTDYGVDDSSVGGMDLDDAPQCFYYSCILDVGLLVLFL